MKTLDLASSAQGMGRKTPWQDSLAAVWDRMMTSTSFYRWSVSNPLTRWITQRRAFLAEGGGFAALGAG